MNLTETPQDVIGFWLAAGPQAWFRKDEAFDASIQRRFAALHLVASRGELNGWARSPEGALALLIVLDQFPRNMYRNSAHAFATDALALSLAHAAVDAGLDHEVGPELRSFFYMPFEHSERMEDQDRAVALFRAYADATGDPNNYLHWAKLHRDIIRRFGRFPHRNLCLGRRTTPEEQAYLDDGGFSG